VRESIVGLRTLPGSNRSLAEVLAEFLDLWKEQSGVSTQLAIDADLRLKPSVELQLVRIIQEALTNIRKHARAARARVDVQKQGDRLLATISDDGVGFNPLATSRGEFPRFGLTTMRERAVSIGATLDLDTTPGSGTTVRFTMPLSAAILF